MNPILEVENITKTFLSPISLNNLLGLRLKNRISTLALKDISFSLRKGAVLGILGSNGAGKTTLLKIISTLILPDEGTVKVDGFRLGGDDEKIKSSVGLVLDEERSFYWRLTGRQNLEFFATLYGLSTKDAKIRIEKLLGLFEVDYADKRFDSYSTGMKKHFALMRALMHEPELVLFDEPTKSLDYTSALNLRNFIKESLVKKQGKTVIFTTHQMAEALDFADLFMILHKSRLLDFGTLDDLRNRIHNPTASLNEIYLRLT